MDLAQIRELLKIVAESGVAEVEIEVDDIKIVARKNAATVMVQAPPMYPAYGLNAQPMYAPPAPHPAPPPQAPPQPSTPPAPSAEPSFAEPPEAQAEPEDDGQVVRAPIVGTFYQAPAPDADPYVDVGDTVKEGDVLCIIEAMKLMNEIESEVAGTVTHILVKNAEPVEYDQPLFVIDPA